MSGQRRHSLTGRARRQAGFSIVELMVALLMGLVLVVGVTQVFLASQTSYRLQDDVSRMQESGRYGFFYLTRELRMAGYLGCSRNAPLINILNSPATGQGDFLFDFDRGGVEGFRGTGNGFAPLLPADLQGLGAATASDVLLVRRVDSGTARLAPPYIQELSGGNAAGVFLQPDHGIETGDILLISDCTASTVFQTAGNPGSSNRAVINQGAGSPGNSTKSLGATYGEGSEISRVSSTVFYIAPGSAGPSLFRAVNGAANAEELVENVERMRVRYGVDTTGNGVANNYELADDVTDWARVVSARVSLLVRGSRDGLTENNQNYVFDGVAITADDGRLRHVITSTVALRNRLR